jgi:diguanylate cyclase (GGDEF)-like protein
MTTSESGLLSSEAREKILLVDDDPAILGLLAAFTTAFGYDASCASNGLEALELLKKQQFDIVITDILMPAMGGMELLGYIKKDYPYTDVIVVTGQTNNISYTDVIKAGASDFISKPFDHNELEAKLNRLVRERHTIQELERLSSHDSLTDLYNRRSFDIKLWEETHRAHRQEYPLFLAMGDLDRFKDYNDRYGHQAGDNVLRAIGQIITGSTRQNVDINCRYGGDEFAIIIPQTTMEQAVQILDRMVTSYHDMAFADTALSMGIARFIRHQGRSWAEDTNDLIVRADRALYSAKADPVNRIVQDPE